MKKKYSKILGIGLTVALLASLVFSVAPVSAITQPSVSLGNEDISAVTDYAIIFNVAKDLPDDGKIVIEFPDGTDLTDVDAGDIDILATSGIGSAPITGGTFTIVKSPDAAEGPTLTATITGLTGDTMIGVGALIQVTVDDVKNPGTPGDYTLDLSTLDSGDVEIESAVTSATYELEAPFIGALPGIVSVYNDGGILMAQFTGITAIDFAMAAAGEDFTVKVGPGTYTEANGDDFYTDADGVTVEATGAVEDTILEGSWYIDNDDITLEGFTIRGEMYIDSGDGLLITDCVFEKLDDAGGDEFLVWWDAFDDEGEIMDSTFDTTNEDADDDIAIVATEAGLTVSGNSFTLDEDDIGVGTDVDTTVENNTFTGSSGVGVGVGGGDVTIEGNTFDSLSNAVAVINGYVDIIGNTMMNNSGEAYTGTWYGALEGGVIDAEDGTDGLLIYNNDIMDTDEDGYVLVVEDDDENIFFHFNNVTGNDGNVQNLENNDSVHASHNWWGSASGPDSDSIDGDVDTSAPLGAKVTGAKIAWDDDGLDAQDAAGVVVEADDWVEIIGAATYASNPAGDFPLTPYTMVTGGGWDPLVVSPIPLIDVYVSGNNDLDDDEEVTIKIYLGTDYLSANSAPYVWSDLQGNWVQASWWGASLFGGYVWVKVTDDTVPAIEDLVGLPMILLETAGAPEAIDVTAPQAGSTGVLVANTAFTWTSVADADSYMIVLSANADLSSPLAREFTPGTAYTHPGPLDYSTPYYVQVVATMEGNRTGLSDITAFTSMSEPVPPPEPDTIIVEPPIIPPAPDVIVNIPPVETPATPSYIWVIIAVGAVLVVSMIILIVRTRRVS